MIVCLGLANPMIHWAFTFGSDIEGSSAAAVILPAILAMTVALADATPSADLERTGIRPNGWMAAGYSLLVTLLGVVALIPGFAFSQGEIGVGGMIRNAVGLVGLSHVGAVVLGPRLSWLLVLPFVIVTTVSPQASTYPFWAWLIHPGSSAPAWAIAVFLGVVGVVSLAVRSPLERSG